MDQTPSKFIDQRRTDQNNNNSSSNETSAKSGSAERKSSVCSCTNISIMQLFHEMKQEFPKVPDHIVQQSVTENCHNRQACLEQLQKVTSSSPTTPTMYPSKAIHNNNSNQQTLGSPMNGLKTGSSRKMKEMTEMFENSSISSSSASSSAKAKIKRPTTLPLRPAPDPPVTRNGNSNNRTPSSTLSTPSSTNSVSSFSTSTTTSQSYPQTHHNVILDSSASKVNDSLNVQLNLKVSPISAKRPAPPPPVKQRFTSHLSVQPEPPYTSILENKNNLVPFNGAVASTGTTGQRSYTNVKLTLRQASPSLNPIDITAGPQTLSYSSSSFNAQQGCESHLKITVAGNGESSIQAVRTAKNASDINQIDTTINIEGNCLMNDDTTQYKIVTNPYISQQKQQLALPQSNNRLTEDELRHLIRRQIKQKELLESELEKEKEKLQMIRLDIITLTSPIMTQKELRDLCDEITRLRTVCEKISDEIDVVTTPQSSHRAIASHNAPPPIPKGLVSRKSHSPSSSLLPHIDMSSNHYPAGRPPSYNEAVAMRETDRIPRREVNSISDNAEEKWTCTICTFQNHHLMDICETCEMPRVSGIRITSSSFHPLLENNHLQKTTPPPTNDNSNNKSNVMQATAL